MNERLAVTKTHKLWVGGKFPRSESGRVLKVFSRKGDPLGLVAHASRKDLRDAVTAAAEAAGQRLTLRMQPGYDHSYFFMASFIADHLAFHAKRLRA